MDPCAARGAANLTDAGGGAAVYRARVDDMSFLRSTMADENAVFTNAKRIQPLGQSFLEWSLILEWSF